MAPKPSKEFGQLDTRGSRRALLEGIVRDPGMQREIGAALGSTEAAEAQRFLDMTPNFVADRDGYNYHELRSFLDRNALLLTAENLALAWKWTVASGRAITRATLERQQSTAPSREALDGLSDRQLMETMSGVLAARRKKRDAVRRASAGPILAE